MSAFSLPHIKDLPEALVQRVLLDWEHYLEAVEQQPIEHAKFLGSIYKVWSVSDFVAQICVREPALIADLFNSGDIFRDYDSVEYIKKLKKILSGIDNEQGLNQALRRFRRREMVRIIWRDLAGWVELEAVIREMSNLADACIEQALRMLYQWQCKTDGMPAPYLDCVQPLLVIAVGKLGGQELNLSSDVDLIFSYPSRGETTGVDNPVTHEQFFKRLGQRLIQTLNQTTADGFVFRVDMRLRPFGNSGDLAVSFSAMENYYREQGRE